MGGYLNQSGDNNGYQYNRNKNNTKDNLFNPNNKDNSKQERDNDLIIEDNTIYEIDRECYERLKKHRRK